MVYPASSMTAHVSDVPNHQVGRTTSFSMRGTVAMAGMLGYELDLSKMTDDETKCAKEQIELAFAQAQKEVDDLHERTREGIQTARLNGKQIGGKTGAKLNVKKAAPAKAIIKQHSKDFGGTLNDAECMKLTGLARNTYYKYKRELKEEQ